MKEPVPRDSAAPQDPGQRSHWPWLLVIACLVVILIALLLPREASRSSGQPAAKDAPGAITAAGSRRVAETGAWHRRSSSAAAPTAEEVVAGKLSEFARDRREVAHAMARRFQVEVPADVERFFDAVEGGRWEELDALGKSLGELKKTDPHSHDLDVVWPAVLETWGIAEQTHAWPAQKLLDYGNAVLGALRPGMVYVGGTDPGRFIPTLLNETSDGERHMVVTQNALADGSYLNYASYLYGDRMATLTQEDSNRVFQDYMTDARKRLEHDTQFPDEAKQVNPGENISNIDGGIQVSGQVAVMAINEKLLQTFMQKNPDLSFALEESFPLKSTYAGAAPLGPIMELRVQDEQNALTAERAAQSLDYWRATTQAMLSDPEASGSPEALKTYSKMAVAQANLLADHNYNAEAEQAYRLASQICPYNPESVSGLSDILARSGRAEEARALLENYDRKNPDQRSFLETAAAWRLVVAPQPTAAPASQP